MDEIDFPDVNPVVPGALNLCFGCLGYLYLGQKRKAVVMGGIWFLSFCTGVGPLLIGAVAAYDGWLLGLKLQSGQKVGEDECGIELLDRLFRR